MKTITLAHVSDLHLPFEPKLSAAQWLARAIKGFVGLGLVKDAEAVGYVPATSALDADSAAAKARPRSGVNGK